MVIASGIGQSAAESWVLIAPVDDVHRLDGDGWGVQPRLRYSRTTGRPVGGTKSREGDFAIAASRGPRLPEGPPRAALDQC